MAIPSQNYAINCLDYWHWLQQLQMTPMIAPFPQSGGMFGGSVSNFLFPPYQLSPLASPVSPGVPPAQPSPHVVGGQTFAGCSPLGSAFSPPKEGIAVARVPPFKALESPRESPEIKKETLVPPSESDSAAIKDEKCGNSKSGKFSVEFLCRSRTPLNLETLAEVSSSRFLTDFADVSGLNLLSEEAAKMMEKQAVNPLESLLKPKIPCCKKHVESPSPRGLIREDCIGSETVEGSPIPMWAVGMRASELELRLKLQNICAKLKEKKKEYQSLSRESRKRKLRKAKIAKNNHSTEISDQNQESPKRRTAGRKRSRKRHRFASVSQTSETQNQESSVKSSQPIQIPVGLEAESQSDVDDEKVVVEAKVKQSEFHLKSTDLNGKSVRVLWLEHGLLYPAIVYPIDPPDIYQLRVEGQRQIRPHILCQEELLLNGVIKNYFD